jgi:hypothetical protein
MAGAFRVRNEYAVSPVEGALSFSYWIARAPGP